MPPKKANKINNTLYVLIWWIVSGEKTITETSNIPKAKRIKNTTVKLKWEGKDGKKKFYFAKIVEFGATIDELEKIRLDNKGNVCDNLTKLFTDNVLQQKNQLDLSKKITKKCEEKNNYNLENNIAHLKPLFPIDKPPLLATKDEQIVKFKSNERSLNDSSFMWDDHYLNNWLKTNSPAIGNLTPQIVGDGQSVEVLSSDLLELENLQTKVYGTSMTKFSSTDGITQQKTTETDGIFRPWDSSSTSNATATTSTGHLKSTEEETILESTETGNVDIPIDVSNNEKNIKESLDVGSLSLFLKNEGYFK